MYTLRTTHNFINRSKVIGCILVIKLRDFPGKRGKLLLTRMQLNLLLHRINWKMRKDWNQKPLSQDRLTSNITLRENKQVVTAIWQGQCLILQQHQTSIVLLQLVDILNTLSILRWQLTFISENLILNCWWKRKAVQTLHVHSTHNCTFIWKFKV